MLSRLTQVQTLCPLPPLQLIWMEVLWWKWMPSFSTSTNTPTFIAPMNVSMAPKLFNIHAWTWDSSTGMQVTSYLPDRAMWCLLVKQMHTLTDSSHKHSHNHSALEYYHRLSVCQISMPAPWALLPQSVAQIKTSRCGNVSSNSPASPAWSLPGED